jgi:hypothetical protein
MSGRIAGWTAALLAHPGRTLFAFALLATVDHWILGPYSYLRWHDLADSHWPRYVAMAQTLSEHGIFAWLPHLAGGGDNAAVGYRLLDAFLGAFILLPDWTVVPLFRIVQVFGAGWFMWRLCRDDLDLDAAPALLSALIIAGLQANLMEHFIGFGAVPLLVWSLARLHDRRDGWAWPLAALLGAAYGIGAPAHLNHPFVLPVVFLWLFAVAGRRDVRLVLLTALTGAGAFAVQVDMLVALSANAPISQRAFWDLSHPYHDRYSKAGWGMIQALTPLLAVTIAAACTPGAGRHVRATAIVAVLVIVVVLVQFPVKRALAEHLGFLSGFTFSRFADLLPFVLAAGAGLAFATVRTWAAARGLSGLVAGRLVAAVALAVPLSSTVTALAVNARDWVQWGSRAAVFDSPQMKAVAREFAAADVPFRVATFQENGLQPSHAAYYGLEAADGYVNLYPVWYQRFWGAVIDPLLRREPGTRDYFQHWGLRLSLFTDEHETVTLEPDRYFDTKLLALAGVRYVFSTVPFSGSKLTLRPDTKPERYWDELSRTEKIRRRLHENFTGRDVLVYRIPDAVPRWFLAPAIDAVADDESMRRHLMTTPLAELRHAVPLAPADAAVFRRLLPSASGAQVEAAGRITPVSYGPDRIELAVDLPAPAALVLTNTFHPSWQASVNGVATPIARAYGTFWAIPLDAGRHAVRFEYRPSATKRP